MDLVLVVDDSPVVCASLGRWLRRAGYEVRTAATGTEALSNIADHAPDLVLLDLTLPDMSGFEVFRSIREREETARIPVVILTASVQREDRVQGLDLGAEDFLTKPAEREELLARVRSLLRSKRLSDRLLMSLLKLDDLGRFAESFSRGSIADLRSTEVAEAMARHILGVEPGSPKHPTVAWAGFAIGHRVVGRTWIHEHGSMRTETTSFALERMKALLNPLARGDEQFLSKIPPDPDLCELFRIPVHPRLANLVALWRGKNILLTADYPWEVGAYEFPLLRATHRLWDVFERLRFEAQEAEKAFFRTMEALALAAEFYDPSTAAHVRRVGTFARTIAKAMGQTRHFVKWIARSAQVHDVGKMTVPLDLVLKHGDLTASETTVMRRHTINGAILLGEGPQLDIARNIARWHHENFDGTGYPDGKWENETPLEARIVRLVDVYDAIRTARPYKPSRSHEATVLALRQGDERVRPSHWDPTVLEAFLDLQGEISRLYEALETSGDAERA